LFAIRAASFLVSRRSLKRHERKRRRKGRPCGAIPDCCRFLKSYRTGAVEKTRTSTAFRPQRPQRCASTSSATTAHHDGPDRVRHQVGAGAYQGLSSGASELRRFYFCACERAGSRGAFDVIEPTPKSHATVTALASDRHRITLVAASPGVSQQCFSRPR